MKINFSSFRRTCSHFLIAGTWFFVAPRVSRAESDKTSIRYGIAFKQMLTGNYGGFFEYCLNDFVGLNVAAEYGYNFFCVSKNGETITDKNISADSLYGTLYYTKYANLPIVTRIYPFGGDFAINLGLSLGYLLGASEARIYKTRELTSEDKINGKNLLNSFQIGFNTGFDYTSSFGLITGISYTRILSSFLHMEENYETFFDSKIQFKIGFDISKVVNSR